MRVLLVHPHIFPGGAEKAVVYLTRNLNLLGHEAALCTLSTELDELPSIAGQVQYLTPEKPIPPSPLQGVRKALSSVLAEVRALRQLTQRHLDDYDLLAPCNFPAYWSTYAHRGLKPIVWISSEVLGPYDASRDLYDKDIFFRSAVKAAAALDRYLVRKSVDKIVTCSELNRQLIKERYDLDSEVIHTGVDYDFFSHNPCDAREELGLKDNYVLLHVGALVKRKNQILSIRALHRLKNKVPDAKLIIVGEGLREPALKGEVRELGLDGDVLFTGRVSEERLRLLYHACDVNLFPVEDQTYGLVPFEAFATGKPSLVSEDSGAGLLMAERGLGYLIHPDVDSIVEAVLKIWRNGEEANKVVEKGRAYVRENLTWDRYATAMAKIYENVSSGAGHREA